MTKILNNIKKIRQENGFTLKDLENLSGVPNSTISKVENGLMIPTQLTMMKISKGLSLEVNQVFDLDYKNKQL